MTEFNLHEILIGTESSWLFLIEIIFRTGIMYFWLLLNVRFLGKRGISDLSAFEFIVVIALGSAAGDPMFYDDIPVVFGMVVITTVVLLEKFLSKMSEKYLRAERVVNGEPSVLIKDGAILEKALDEQELNQEELLGMLRQQGVKNIGEVEFGVLETSGKLSVIRFPRGSEKHGSSTVAELKEITARNS